MGTKIRPFNLHTSVDSHVKGLIDSDYVQARQTAGTDSSSTQAMIDSNFANMDVDIHMPDNQKITFGNDSDGSIRHSGSNFQLLNTSGGIQVTNYANDLDVDIRTDDGSGGTALYFKADGSTGSAELYHYGSKKIETLDSGASVTGNIAANIRSNPKGFSVTHTVDSSDNALLVGPINVDSGVTLTINGTLMVV